MKKIRFKMNNGFAASDALIAILIIALFSGLIATVSYNIYLANSNIKRMSKANSYIAEVFEYADKIYYDDVTVENLTEYFNNKYYYSDGISKPGAMAKIKETEDEVVETPFKISLKVINYNKTEGNTDKLDLLKQITITVEYVLGNRNQKMEMTTIKKREKLEVPNIPNLASIKLNDEENIYPIKDTNEGFIVCNKNDNSWYNYQNSNWARIIVTKSNLKEGDKINKENIALVGTEYYWIPKYAYNNNKIVFLYGNSSKYLQNIEGYNSLIEIDKTLYTIPADFRANQEDLDGIWTNNSSLSVYQILNNVYPIKN